MKVNNLGSRPPNVRHRIAINRASSAPEIRRNRPHPGKVNIVEAGGKLYRSDIRNVSSDAWTVEMPLPIITKYPD